MDTLEPDPETLAANNEAAQVERDILYYCNASQRATNELTQAIHKLVGCREIQDLVAKTFHGKVNFNIYELDTICEVRFNGTIWTFAVFSHDGTLIRQADMTTSGFTMEDLNGFLRAILRAWRNSRMNHRIQPPKETVLDDRKTNGRF